jgi:hypothetical protein
MTSLQNCLEPVHLSLLANPTCRLAILQQLLLPVRKQQLPVRKQHKSKLAACARGSWQPRASCICGELMVREPYSTDTLAH